MSGSGLAHVFKPGGRQMNTGVIMATGRVMTGAGVARKSICSPVPLFACLGVTLVVLLLARDLPRAMAQSALAGNQLTQDTPQVNPDGFTSSSVCGHCHQAIHAVWQHSLHSDSWSNGVFQAAYRRSTKAYGGQKTRLCLSCHAPTVRHTKDFAVEDPITAEGVTCDFCHSVQAVDLSDPNDPLRLTVGEVKYGPLKNAQSPAHQIVDSQLHTRSEFCAPCHEYRNANGLTVLGTYSEWKGSPYAKRGTQCQDCHMPLVPGRVVAIDVKARTPTSVNLHDVSGSHDIERVREAIALEMTGFEWIGDRVWVYLTVENKGSGHCFPTGLPMHRAVLEVTVRDGGSTAGRREIPFEVVMLDKTGRPLRREHEVFVEGARVRSDTRLKPKEVRRIDVSFRDIKASRLALSAAIYYEYSTETLVREEGKERIEPVEMKFLVASHQSTLKPVGR